MRGNFRGEVLRKNCPLSAYSMVLATVILLVVSAAQIANGGNYIAHSHPKPLLAENTFSGDLAKHVSLFGVGCGQRCARHIRLLQHLRYAKLLTGAGKDD